MYTKTVLVTPQMAEEYLSRNSKNRSIRPDRVDHYAREMQSGNWRKTGETLKFSVGGRLLDGQHRLAAILKAKVSINFLCVYDLEDSSFEFIDTGVPRQAADILTINGVAYANQLAAALRLQHLFDKGAFVGGADNVSRANRMITNHNISEALARHTGYQNVVQQFNTQYKKLAGLVPSSYGIFFLYNFGKQDATLAAEFFYGIGGISSVAADSPVHLLRERLIANRIAKTRIKKTELCALVIKAWIAFRDQRPMQSLRFSRTEKYPTFELRAA